MHRGQLNQEPRLHLGRGTQFRSHNLLNQLRLQFRKVLQVLLHRLYLEYQLFLVYRLRLANQLYLANRLYLVYQLYLENRLIQQNQQYLVHLYHLQVLLHQLYRLYLGFRLHLVFQCYLVYQCYLEYQRYLGYLFKTNNRVINRELGRACSTQFFKIDNRYKTGFLFQLQDTTKVFFLVCFLNIEHLIPNNPLGLFFL